MPKPKLIQFETQKPPEPEPSQDIFEKKPKAPRKFVPPTKDVDIVVPEPEPEYEPEPEPEPTYEEQLQPVKKKKQISEKQRLHLENMRKKKAENFARRQAAEGVVPRKPAPQGYASQPPPAPRVARPVPPVMDEDANFESWLKNFEKFDKVMAAREEKERKKLEEEAAKEAEIEARIRKKIAEENAQRLGHSHSRQSASQQAPPAVLQSGEERFGKYSKMFGY